MKPKPKTFDECLAAMADDQRAALEKLRKTIRAAAPKAEECISYGLRRVQAGRQAAGRARREREPLRLLPHERDHGGRLHQPSLRGYDTSKGTIRFPATNRCRPRWCGSSSRPASRRTRRSAEGQEAGQVADPAVAAFLEALDHPLKPEIEAVRKIILGVSPEIREGIKWNAPSFRTTDWFATCNVHAKDKLRLILHFGGESPRYQGLRDRRSGRHAAMARQGPCLVEHR